MIKLNFLSRFNLDKLIQPERDAGKVDQDARPTIGQIGNPPFKEDSMGEYQPKQDIELLHTHKLRKKYNIESVIGKEAERNEKIEDSYESGESGTALSQKFSLSSPIANTAVGSKDTARSVVSADSSTPTKTEDSD